MKCVTGAKMYVNNRLVVGYIYPDGKWSGKVKELKRTAR